MTDSGENQGQEAQADDVFSVERIRSLVELMKEHDLREVDLRHFRQRIRICRGPQEVAMMAAPAMPAPQFAVPAVAAAPTAAPAPAATAAPAAVDGPHIVTIKSPMVGTLYLRPNPKADSFVKVGQSITPESTICIIEAMKVFNEIPAEVRGKVVEILCGNEEPVDFGRPLFKVDTRG
ncbi:MAG: acetyl-CoA carboxylase biotin carboxyl carrier protein [Planctomycetaceae bacterium]|nr:acetyl-CoA carboxylase biotin carboxyl carrier protein [Planctomycetaceae bacterium]